MEEDFSGQTVSPRSGPSGWLKAGFVLIVIIVALSFVLLSEKWIRLFREFMGQLGPKIPVFSEVKVEPDEVRITRLDVGREDFPQDARFPSLQMRGTSFELQFSLKTGYLLNLSLEGGEIHASDDLGTDLLANTQEPVSGNASPTKVGINTNGDCNAGKSLLVGLGFPGVPHPEAREIRLWGNLVFEVGSEPEVLIIPNIPLGARCRILPDLENAELSLKCPRKLVPIMRASKTPLSTFTNPGQSLPEAEFPNMNQEIISDHRLSPVIEPCLFSPAGELVSSDPGGGVVNKGFQLGERSNYLRVKTSSRLLNLVFKVPTLRGKIRIPFDLRTGIGLQGPSPDR